MVSMNFSWCCLISGVERSQQLYGISVLFMSPVLPLNGHKMSFYTLMDPRSIEERLMDEFPFQDTAHDAHDDSLQSSIADDDYDSDVMITDAEGNPLLQDVGMDLSDFGFTSYDDQVAATAAEDVPTDAKDRRISIQDRFGKKLPLMVGVDLLGSLSH